LFVCLPEHGEYMQAIALTDFLPDLFQFNYIVANLFVNSHFSILILAVEPR
jgi:hypothetical protein